MNLTGLRLMLGDKECRVAELKLAGLSNEEIANKMGLAKKSVSEYIRRVKKKLGENWKSCGIFMRADYSNLLHTNKCNYSNSKSGKEILQQQIRTGFTKMAFNYHGSVNEPDMNAEMKLCLAINGIGDRRELLRRRGETLKTMSASARHRVIKLLPSEMNEDVKRTIHQNCIQLIKTETEESGTAHYYVCKTRQEYNNLMAAITGGCEARYDEHLHRISLFYSKPVYVERILITDLTNGIDKPVFKEEIGRSRVEHHLGCVLNKCRNYKLKIWAAGYEHELEIAL